MTLWCLIPNFILYFLASLFYLSLPFGRSFRMEERKSLRLAHYGFVLTSFGVFLHGAYLVYLISQKDFLPLSFVSLSGMVLFLWLAGYKKWQGLGAIFVPLSFILWILSLAQKPESHLFQGVSWFVFIHVGLALLAFVFMFGNFGLGIAFWIHERRLKQKSLDLLSGQLPPLLLNEKLALALMQTGFGLLTFVLLSGAMTASGRPSHVALALTAWGVYFCLLIRQWRRFNARKMLLLSFIGFVSLALTYLWS